MVDTMVSVCQKLLLLRGSSDLHHYPSGQWHICRTPHVLKHQSSMIILQLSLTWDDDVLPISARSSKMAKEGSAREHLACRGRKLIRDADIDISSSVPTAILSVENLNPVDGDWGAVVNGKPGCSVVACVADCAGNCAVNTVGCSSQCPHAPHWW